MFGRIVYVSARALAPQYFVDILKLNYSVKLGLPPSVCGARLSAALNAYESCGPVGRNAWRCNSPSLETTK